MPIYNIYMYYFYYLLIKKYFYIIGSSFLWLL